MSVSFSELLRDDPLTGCKNYLGFLEALVPPEERSRSRIGQYRIDSSCFSALFFVDMNDLYVLNETRGFGYGDSILRWMGILLREESQTEVYRMGGDEFAILLQIGTREGHLELIERIHRRMELEAEKFGFPGPAADTTLIFFDQTPVSLDSILIQMGQSMMKVKNAADSHAMVFDAAGLEAGLQPPDTWESMSVPENSSPGRWLALNNIHQVLKMGVILDETQKEAYTDAISGLPNMKAALLSMERSIRDSATSRQPFSILMIDGDNIRAYNNINYAAGDQMIRDLCAVLKENIRPRDFIARWRTGDEFLLILPDTPAAGAGSIGERILLAVRETSKGWRFPVTVSIGVASYPAHAEEHNTLIDKVEAANKRAKDGGKDRVMLAE